MAKLFLIRGLPGSGKSTVARNMGIAHFEADMYFMQNGKYEFNPALVSFAHAWCKGMVKDYLERGEDVVVSNTFIRLWEMDDYIQIAEDLGVDVEVQEMPLRLDPNCPHPVSDHVVKRMLEKWEPLVKSA